MNIHTWIHHLNTPFFTTVTKTKHDFMIIVNHFYSFKIRVLVMTLFKWKWPRNTAKGMITMVCCREHSIGFKKVSKTIFYFSGNNSLWPEVQGNTTTWVGVVQYTYYPKLFNTYNIHNSTQHRMNLSYELSTYTVTRLH